MRNFKKLISGIFCIGMLLSVSTMGVSADIETATTIDSTGATVEIASTKSENIFQEDTVVTLDNGETVTLPKYTTVIEIDGKAYAYYTTKYSDDRGYIYDYMLSDGTKINGYPMFDTELNYIGCCETRYPYAINSELPNGETLDFEKMPTLQMLFVYYDAEGNFDGYGLSLKPVCVEDTMYETYVKNQNGNPYVITPEGEEIEFLDGNRVTLRYNSQCELIAKTFYSASLPVEDDDTIGDSTTIGESETTIRGDVNLDGKVTTADLLYLKKYLLGLITW